MGRREVLIGGGALVVAGALGAVAYSEDLVPGTEQLKRRLADKGPDGTIPDVPAGDVRLERVSSAARGAEVDLFTAVPDGHGDGAGLPVVLVLHGASGRPSDYAAFGLPRFLTAAARDGVPPFVLVGLDGGRRSWRSSGDDDPDDPQRMLIDELPGWLAPRRFDLDRRAAWGWSMGGHGALLLAEATEGDLAAVAAFSPAIPSEPDGLPPTADGRPRDVWSATDRLATTPVGLWCGTADPLVDRVQRFADALDPSPAIAAWSKGDHTRGYWDRITPAAFAFLGDALAR